MIRIPANEEFGKMWYSYLNQLSADKAFYN